MKYNIIFLTLFALILFSSCQDVVDLDVPDGDVLLVVDGMITDQEGEKQVLISTTANYFDNVEPPRVEDAVVILYEDNAPIDTFLEPRAGVYATQYVGIIGKSYHLYIRTAAGEEYTSNPQTMNFVPPITDIYYEFREESAFEEEGYYVMIDTEEPMGVGDHYRWRQFVDGVPLQEPFDLLYASDEFVDGNPIIGFDVTTQPLELGDNYRIEQMSISLEHFDFLTQLQTQTAFVGSLFDSPPAALDGNIQSVDPNGKEALGFFGVSAVSEAEVVIE